MTDQTPPDDIDPGAPVEEIVALREAPSEGFLVRVRDGILRRVAGTQALDFAVSGFLDFLKEMGELFFGIFGGTEPREPGKQGGGNRE